MTLAEFMPIVLKINAIWGKGFDEIRTRVWYEIFSGLKLQRLDMAVSELGRESKFEPRPAEIVEKYEEIRQRARKSQARRTRISDQKMPKCYICLNDGTVFYEKTVPDIANYIAQYMARCTCERGKDLRRWSKHQITKGMTVTNPTTKEEESIYFPDISDVLTLEEIGVIQAKNMGRSTEAQLTADVAAMVKKLQAGGVA